jgi:hypothetical protein
MRPLPNHRDRIVDREIMKLELRQRRQLALALQPRSQDPRDRPSRPLR